MENILFKDFNNLDKYHILTVAKINFLETRIILRTSVFHVSRAVRRDQMTPSFFQRPQETVMAGTFAALQQLLDYFPTLERAGQLESFQTIHSFLQDSWPALTAKEICFRSWSTRSSGNVTSQLLLCHFLNYSFPVWQVYLPGLERVVSRLKGSTLSPSGWIRNKRPLAAEQRKYRFTLNFI